MRVRLKVLVAALVAAVALSACGSGGSGDKPAATEPQPPPADVFAGIPQSGVTLGSPQAKVTLYEFADLQCPFCRDFTRNGPFHRIVTDYVKTGKVKLVWRNLTFIGADSVTAARAAAAAGAQNRLWQFVDAFYAKQGTENSGYVTPRFLAEVATAAGVDAAKMKAAMGSPSVEQQLGEAQRQASSSGVNSTPSFLVQVGSKKPRKLVYRDFSFGSFSGPIERAIASAP